MVIAQQEMGAQSGLKLEPAFLAENEEALFAAGYVKQYSEGKGGKPGRGKNSQGS